MTRILTTTLIVLIGALASAPAVVAQVRTPAGRGFIVVNGGYQVGSHDFEQVSTLRANVEDGSFTTDYDVKSGPSFDVAGGATVWRRLAVGVGVTRFSRSTASTLSGSVPHPFFFNRPRTVSGDIAGLKREELAIHVEAIATAPIGRRLQVMAFGGPSFFRVNQGVVSTFAWSESYPYDEASFSSATTVDADGSKIGFNVGGDVAFFFSRQVGVGGSIRYSAATVEIDVAGGTHDVKAGGVQAGGGLRLRF
jgi:opacity protein-like surface antigen